MTGSGNLSEIEPCSTPFSLSLLSLANPSWGATRAPASESANSFFIMSSSSSLIRAFPVASKQSNRRMLTSSEGSSCVAMTAPATRVARARWAVHSLHRSPHLLQRAQLYLADSLAGYPVLGRKRFEVWGILG